MGQTDKVGQTDIQTDRQTDIQTDRQTDIFFIVVLGLGEVNKHAKKILGRSEKKTYGNHYGNICPEFFGHIKTNDPLTNR